MDEARRFLRFIVPGALFGMLSVAMLLLLVPEWTVSKLSTFTKEGSVTLAIAGVIGSGALGYAFSVMHHQLNWSFPRWSTIDHTQFVHYLANGQQPTLLVQKLGACGSESTLIPQEIDRETAQALLDSLWYQHLGTDPIKSADPKVMALADTAHSAGIARVAALWAFILAMAVALSVGQPIFELGAVLRTAMAIGIGVGSIVLFWRTYLRVGLMAQRVIENVILKALSDLEEKSAILRITE